ncbi:MAG: RluA family pseudouridine synthase [Clostridia bacterium]|nr:RluA family pseudouridine synthase [Clostridia bacterium]
MNEMRAVAAARCDGMRITEYLRREMGISVTLLKKVKYGGVFINEENVHMRATVREGDRILVRLPEEKSDGIRPIEMPLDIVYEDEYIIAVNKPRDMPTHPSKGNSLPTLAEGLMAYFDGSFVFRAINRLDRDTSGIVIVAKDAFTADKLSSQMKSFGYSKKYYAVISGIPKEKSGVIDAPIERVCEGNMKRCVRPDGKRALTEYTVIATDGKERSLCEVTLHTGRTHQIRVHMAYIGHPLYADFLYGERIDGESYKLHAREISFTHPITGEKTDLYSRSDFEDDKKWIYDVR